MVGYKFMKRYLVELGVNKKQLSPTWFSCLKKVGKPCCQVGWCPYGGDFGTVIGGIYCSLAYDEPKEKLPPDILEFYCDSLACFCPVIAHTKWTIEYCGLGNL